MFDSLRSISPKQILKNTDSIVAQDRKLTLRLLEHLHEIDRRKLYLECGFASLFDYCARHLKLAEPSAARRIRAARCVARYPQLYSLLESGELNPTVVSMMSKHIKPGNVDDVINRIKGKSKREVERIIAEYEPKAAMPADRARVMIVPIARRPMPVAPTVSAEPPYWPIPSVASTSVPMAAPRSTNTSVSVTAPPVDARSTVEASVSPSLTAGSNFTVTGDSEKSPNHQQTVDSGSADRADCRANAFELEASESQPESPTNERESVQFERFVRVEFTVHEALMNDLERVRSIASHRLPANAPLEDLLAFVTKYFLEKEDPARRQARRESRFTQQEKSDSPTSTSAAKTVAEARFIPAQVRDKVFVRDNECSYVSPDGQRCCSTHVLQVDHIKPVARGGASTIDNLRLLCAYHNRLESERLMGRRGRSRGLTSRRNRPDGNGVGS